MPGPKYPSAGLLKGFLKDNSIPKEAAAKALGVTRITIWSWINEESAPSDKARVDIETWTNSEVPASGWPPVKDRRKSPKEIEPFKAPTPANDDPPASEPTPTKPGEDDAA